MLKKSITTLFISSDPCLNAYRKQGDVISQPIALGELLPKKVCFKKFAQSNRLVITDRYESEKYYARTLNYWLSRFNAQREKIMTQSKDKRFVDLCCYYLASCIAAFLFDRTNVAKLEICRV